VAARSARNPAILEMRRTRSKRKAVKAIPVLARIRATDRRAAPIAEQKSKFSSHTHANPDVIQSWMAPGHLDAGKTQA
jgi:hypothetical protein